LFANTGQSRSNRDGSWFGEKKSQNGIKINSEWQILSQTAQQSPFAADRLSPGRL
jgi:hypothetical protein